MPHFITAKSHKLTTLAIATLIALTFVATNATMTKANDVPDQLNKSLTLVPITNSPTGKQTPAADKAVLTNEELKLLHLINQERAHTGLPELEVDPTLVKLARAKSRDMVSQNYFGHISEQLGTIYDQLAKAEFTYEKVAENLVGAHEASKAHQSLMSSAAHRSNILGPKYTKVGIGISKGGPYGQMITEIFIQ